MRADEVDPLKSLRRHALTVGASVTLAVAWIGVACPGAHAWDRDGVGDGAYTTHQWILQEADRLAAARGADWLDLPAALSTAAGAGARYPGFVTSTMGPGPGLQSSVAGATYYYQEAVTALSLGDSAAASKALGAFARWYSDLCEPLRAAGFTTKDRTVARYEAAVFARTDDPGENEDWVRTLSAREVRGVTSLALQAAATSRSDAGRLRSAFRRSGLRGTALGVTKASLSRAVNGLCDVIVRLQRARLVDVRDLGARGDGVTLDTAAFTKALDKAASDGTGVWVPAGTYRVQRLVLPDRITVRGPGSDLAWIEGGLSFRSFDLVAGLKIGDRKASTGNHGGAAQTVFQDCRLRGGGGAGYDSAVLTLGSSSGSSRSLDHVTFSDCEIERNLGVEDWSVNRGSGRGFNDISVHENPAAGGSHVTDLKFVGCHIGVSNGAGGHDTGSPRAGIEVWSGPGKVAQGWHRVTIRDCTFEATDRFCIDFSDDPKASGRHVAGPVLIEGNLIKGGGYGPGKHPRSYSICLEAPRNVTIRGNTIYAAYASTVCGSYGPASHTVIVDNIINLTVDNGVHQTGDEAVVLKGRGGVFVRNVVYAGVGSGPLLYLKETARNRVAGNRFYDTRAGGNPAMVLLRDASHNVVTGNLFSTAADSAPRILVKGLSFDNKLRPNTFRHR